MTIGEMLQKRTRPLLSFEFFPPKDETGVESLKRAAQKLLAAQPDFVTVTYGAGGSTRQRTLEICDTLRQMGFRVVMPHLTCVENTRGELAGIVDDLYRRGYRNIMTLRGDPPKGATQFQVAAGGLAHASDLVALIKQHHPDIGCGVAGYPEKHPEADTLAADIRHLKLKVDAGADFITTQLFFENRFYLDFVARCRAAGIHQPIVPGLLPAVSLAQAQRMTSRCQTALPAALADAMQAAGGEGAAAEQVGIEWSARQIRELLERDVPGIHLYVLNRSKAALSPALLDCFARFRKP